MSLLRIACVLGALLSLAVLNTPALADSNRHRNDHDARLSGNQEVPVVVTQGSGRFEMTIAPDDSSFDFTLTYEDLEGATAPPVTPTQAHIHIGQKNVNGGIVVFLCTNLVPLPAGVPAPPACPASPGTVTGTRTAADVLPQPIQGIAAGELAAVLSALRKGNAYANVHTPVSPTGEIRGQISRDHHHDHDRD